MFPTLFHENDKHPYGGLNPHSITNIEVSKALTGLIKQFGNLRPGKQILDLGCGTGRILFELKNHIVPSQYVGIDCNDAYLDILKKTHGEQFRTIHIDAENPAFNPTGGIKSNEFSIPLPDGSQTLILCFALFNHQPFDWINVYLKEMDRLLANDGIVLSTWFLLSRYYAKEKPNLQHAYQFNHVKNLEYHIDAACSYKNLAYAESDIRAAITQQNLRIVEPIKYGQWVNGPAAVTGHDFIIMRKRM